MKRPLWLIGAFIIIIIFAGFFLLLTPPAGATKTTFDIPIKTGFAEIAKQLEASRLIRSRYIFEIYALVVGQASNLKPGRYLIEAPKSVPGLVNLFVAGSGDIIVTIPPGMTLAEIDDKLTASGILGPGELKAQVLNDYFKDYPWLAQARGDSKIELSATGDAVLPQGLTKFKTGAIIDEKRGLSSEGFLLPDTYHFSFLTRAAVIQKFLNNFENKALPLFGDKNNLRKVLIIASILEKEVPDYNDQRIVAGILEKRLKAGIPLQVDATVQYAKCGGRFLGCPALATTDYKKVDSDYNTYLYTGLPPGPIGNPGLAAIEAALNSLKTNYWYYLSDPKTKKTIFSETLDEHNDNQSRYLLRG